MIPSPSLMIWRHALGRSQRRTATSIAASRATRIARAMIQRLRGMTASRLSRSPGRSYMRVDLGGRAEVLAIPVAEFVERVRVLLRPAVLDGVDGRQVRPARPTTGQGQPRFIPSTNPARKASPAPVGSTTAFGLAGGISNSSPSDGDQRAGLAPRHDRDRHHAGAARPRPLPASRPSSRTRSRCPPGSARRGSPSPGRPAPAGGAASTGRTGRESPPRCIRPRSDSSPPGRWARSRPGRRGVTPVSRIEIDAACAIAPG